MTDTASWSRALQLGLCQNTDWINPWRETRTVGAELRALVAEGKRKVRAGLIDLRGGNLNSGGEANPTRESGPSFWSLDVQGVWLIVLGEGIEL